MALSLKSTGSVAVARRAVLSGKPIVGVALPVKRVARRVAVQATPDINAEVNKALSVITATTTLFAAGNAQAAQEISTLAASDNRLSIISLLFVPALGWVAFNILQPALNQLDKMTSKTDAAPSTKKARRGVAGAVGLGAASLLSVQSADAATELAQLAASDNRLPIIATLFVPAVGWVLFNILGPATNQLNRMSEMNTTATPKKGATKRRGVAAVVGLGGAASMLLAEQADAATELSQLAASDNRLPIIATLFVPALGWVLFNILQPALNQLNKMQEVNQKPAKKTSSKRRGIAAAVGLGSAASLLAVQSADAATELAQLAASDNRLPIIATLFVPAVGWVLFNILGPATNQLNRMSEMNTTAAPKKATNKRR